MPKTPYRDPSAYEGLPEGAWLVIVKPGSTTARHLLKPAFADVEAALEVFADDAMKVMHKAGELRRSRIVTMSAKERKAWAAFKKTMGADMPTSFEYASLQEIVRAGCDAIRDKVINHRKYDTYDPK